MLKYPISGRGPGERIRDTERDNLYIGWDDEDGFVMLFTPTMLNTDTHYHVELSEEEAVKLASFIEKKLFSLRSTRGNWESARQVLKNASDVEPEIDDRL